MRSLSDRAFGRLQAKRASYVTAQRPCRHTHTCSSRPTHACRAAERDPQAQQTASPGREELQQALKRAVAAEDYAEAARLKQQLDDALLQDPLVVLRRQLQAAVDEERYQVGRSIGR